MEKFIIGGVSITALLLFVVSCSNHANYEKISNQKLFSIDTLLIDVPSGKSPSLSSLTVENIRDTEYLIGYNFKDFSIDFYSLEDKRFERTINLESEGPNFITGLTAFTLLSNGNMIIADNNYLSIIDSIGHVMERLSLNGENSDLNGLDFTRCMLTVNRDSGLQYNSKKGTVILEAILFDQPDELKYSPYLVELNVEERKVKMLDLPKLSDSFKFESNFGSLRGVNFLLAESKMILNPRSSSKVFEKTGTAIREYNLNSSYSSNLAMPLERQQSRANLARVRHKSESAEFYPIVYDRHQMIYVRSHKSEYDEIRNKSDFYFIVADRGFNKIGELPVPEGYYIFPVISSKGILFNAIEKYDDRLEFLVYRLK